MFVRWKRRETSAKAGFSAISRYRAATRGATLYAVLVESMRVNGKPQQRFVCHLTSIKENKLAHTDTPFYFWDDVSKKLSALNLDATERQKIETVLAAKIRRPDDAEIARWLAERAARLKQLTERLTAKLGVVRSA